MIIPSEPLILLSYVNTLLRDHYNNLDELCAAQNVSKELIIERLEKVGFVYDEERNKFE